MKSAGVSQGRAMTTKTDEAVKQDFSAEVAEWIEAFDDVVAADWEQGAELLETLRQRAREAGVPVGSELTTAYLNTIPKHDEVEYPGDRHLERRVEALIRWNAMAMVHGQNKKDAGIGGHISTYSSLATLLEVGFNHFSGRSMRERTGRSSRGISSTFRDMHRRGFMRGRIWKGDLMRRG